MIGLDIVDDNEYNNNFHLRKYFHQLAIVDNQDIFDDKGEIELRFFAYYTRGIFINLTFFQETTT